MAEHSRAIRTRQAVAPRRSALKSLPLSKRSKKAVRAHWQIAMRPGDEGDAIQSPHVDAGIVERRWRPLPGHRAHLEAVPIGARAIAGREVWHIVGMDRQIAGTISRHPNPVDIFQDIVRPNVAVRQLPVSASPSAHSGSGPSSFSPHPQFAHRLLPGDQAKRSKVRRQGANVFSMSAPRSITTPWRARALATSAGDDPGLNDSSERSRSISG
jgi:hypothetical protein